MDNIKVSVSMITYNHSKYIEKAIRSVMMQKTNFKYELIVADDASTDNNQEIIARLSKEFPDKIKPILREKNLGMRNNSADSLSRCQGEYIAILEGDDYWTDPYKLQKQVDFLDNNKEYFACYHKNMKIDEAGNIIEPIDKNFDIVGDFSVENLNKLKIPGQSATLLARSSYQGQNLKDFFQNFDIKLRVTPGDTMFTIIMLSYGKIYCMPDVMSAYRYFVKDGASNWSSKYSRDNRFVHLFFVKMRSEIEMLGKEFNVPINLEKAEYDAFIDALWKYKFQKKYSYIINIIYMFFFSNHKDILRKKAVPVYKAEIAARKSAKRNCRLNKRQERKANFKRRLKEKCPRLAAFLKKVKKVLSKLSSRK